MTRTRLPIISLLASLSMAMILFSAAPAFAFPDKTVRIVVTFPPGGPLDTLSRAISARLSERWGQPVVVDNRAGGHTLIGAEHVRTSPPDGHTLMMAIDSTLVMNQHLISKLPYDPIKDFTPITLTSHLNLIFAVHADSPYRSMTDLVEAARKSPGKISIGAGSVSTQLCIELLKTAAGIDVLYVPYRGSAPVVQATLGREVDATCDGLAGTTPHIRVGRLHGLAVTGSTRFSGLPDVPTLAQAGVPGMEFVVWTALVGPAGVPAAVVEKINRDVREVLALDEVRSSLLPLGIETAGSSASELARMIKVQGEGWADPIRKAGIKLE